MKKILFIFLIGVAAIPIFGDEHQFPQAVLDYQHAANSENISMYMKLFSPDMIMIDVGRVFDSHSEIRTWALGEVIPNGSSFKPLEVLVESAGYYKTMVKWMRWEVLYYFWTNESGKIRKMSLQYQQTGSTGINSVYNALPPSVSLYFDSIKSGSLDMLDECFTGRPSLTVVSRTFTGLKEIRRFVDTEVLGGEYQLMDLIEESPQRISIHLKFTPAGWSRPEPDAIYTFYMEGSRIKSMDLQYK